MGNLMMTDLLGFPKENGGGLNKQKAPSWKNLHPRSFSEVVEVMPQMGPPEKQSTGEMWHLGLAHHEVSW